MLQSLQASAIPTTVRLVRRCCPFQPPSQRFTRGFHLSFPSTHASSRQKQGSTITSDAITRELEFDEQKLESARRCQMEFNSGAGGVEAMIFNWDLMRMYENFARRHNWAWRQMEVRTFPCQVRMV